MWGSLTGSDLWVHAGWTMLHYLWVGTLLGLGAWVCHGGVRSASAGARYVVALGCLGALAVAPIAIAVWIGVPPGLQRPSTSSEPTRVGVVEYQAGPPIAAALEPEPAGQEPMCAGSFPAASSTWHAVVTLLPWLWLVGSPLIMAWSMAGLAGAERLRRLSSPTGDRELDALCRRLARSLKISRDVSIRVCTRIAAPVLVGLVRPVILLPPSLLSGLTPRQLEMILLHELAHVRRYDNLMNFAQRMIESALFFHPAVWLVSRWVRREREHCCDELVVRRLGDRVSYAGTLLVVVRQGLSASRAALPVRAAGGAVSSVANSHLRSRVRQILGRDEETMQISRKLGALVPVVLLTVVVMAGSFGLSSGWAEPAEASHAAVASRAEREVAPEPDASQLGDEERSSDDALRIADELDGSDSREALRIGGKRAEEPGDSAQPQPAEADEPTTAKLDVDWCNTYSEALVRNVEELRRQKWQIKRCELELIAAKNYLLSRLDSVGRYRWMWLGDKLIDTERSTDPFDNAYQSMTGGNFQEWHLGLEVTIPIGFRKELAGVRQAQLNLAKEREILREMELELSHQLQQAFRDLERYYQQVEGLVLAVNGDNLVEISIGSDDGLRKGQELLVYPQGETTIVPLGEVEVIESRPDRAVCRILSKFPHKQIRKGDRVATSLPAGGAAVYTRALPAEGGASVSRPARQPDARSPGTISGTTSMDAAGKVAGDRAKMTEDVLEVVETIKKARIRDMTIVFQTDAQEPWPPAAAPRAEAGRRSEAKTYPKKPISKTVTIDAAGKITANGKQITLDELRDVLDGVKKQGLGARLTIVVDRDTRQELILEVLKAFAAARIVVERVAIQGVRVGTGPPAATARPEPDASED